MHIPLSFAHSPSPFVSALRFACYSRRNFRAHTYGKYLKVFAPFWVFIASLSFSLSLPLARSTLIATKLMTMWVISISSVCRKAAWGGEASLPAGHHANFVADFKRANAAN